MSIWTNWDPLEEIIVGNCLEELPWHWALDLGNRTAFNTILKETKEDLDNLANMLESLGVKVHRPTPVDFKQDISIGAFNVVAATSPIVPRDQYLVYGDTIYQTYTSMPDRYLDSLNYYDIFRELYKEGYNWISQPPPELKNFEKNTKWYVQGPEIYGNYYKDKILWHTATMFKCGDALITNDAGPGTQLGLEWMKRNTGARIINNDNTVVDNWGHIDHGFYLINDNTVICINKNWVPEALRNKSIVEMEGLYSPFNYKDYIAKTHHKSDKLSMEWINEWLTEWKGYAQEVAFEFNVLVVDPNNVIFSTEQPYVFKALEKLGVKSHVCKMRHGMFWEAGIHCLTLDVKRHGEKRSVV